MASYSSSHLLSDFPDLRQAIELVKARPFRTQKSHTIRDIDFVDPAFAPGTGTPEVGSFRGAHWQRLLRGLIGIHFIGYDLVEVMPPYDPAGITSLLGANLIYEFIALEALQRWDRNQT